MQRPLLYACFLLTLAACSNPSGQGVRSSESGDDGGRRPLPSDDGGDRPGTDAGADATEPDVVQPRDIAAAPDAPAPADAEAGSDTAQADSAGGADVLNPVDAGGRTDADDVCVATGATAASSVLPVDTIWIVDNSLSMQEEVELISANINAFASFIGSSGIDYRVVMLAYDDPTVGDGWYHVCVPPPLSNTAVGVCPRGRDVDADRYLHVREIVDSTNGLTIALREFAEYRDFLRPEAVQHLVVVSDDNAEQSADDFLAAWRAQAPWLADTVVHSIVTQTRAEIRDPFDDSCTRPGCPCGYAVGSVHMELSRTTGGESFSICDADWSAIFDAIADTVVEGTVLPCSYDVAAPAGELLEIDAGRVNVFFTPAGGSRTLVPGRDAASDCGDGPGWYWPAQPATGRVELCPASCGLIDGAVELEFGCLTVKG